MKKRVTISLTPEWFEWMQEEALHRDQSYSELIEDALLAFQEKLIAAFEANLKIAGKKTGKRKFISV